MKFTRSKANIVISFIILVSSILTANGQGLPVAFFENFHYREIGPTRQGGRVVSLAVSQQDPYTYFVGAGPGGLFKTTNNGNTFESVFDNQGTSGIGDVEIAPGNDQIVWVGTGEANLRNSTQYGDGVYKSVDGGHSWKHMGLKETEHIGKVVIHPTNPDIVYIAAQGKYYADNEERGVYKTTNGGKTWKKVLSVKDAKTHVGATDLVMDPSNPEILYATTYQRIRKPWGFSGSGTESGIYKTMDGGKNWSKLASGLPSGFIGKIGLAIYPQNPNILYAIIEDANANDLSADERWKEIQSGKQPSKKLVGNIVYRTDDAGQNWYQASLGNVGSRSNYYGQIIVDPNNENTIYVLSEKVDVSFDAGKTWKKAFEYGGDNHVLWINPKDSRHMMLGYDYGFARSFDSGKNWLHVDNLSMAQLYAISVDMDYPYNVYGGLQDFGTWKGPSAKKGRFPIRFEDWEHVLGGDGFYSQVDPTNSRWLYCESQFGGLSRNDQKIGTRTQIQYKKEGIRYNWSAPLLISPHNPKKIYHGANVLLMSDNMGESWKEISPDLSKNDLSKTGGAESRVYGTLTSISESPIKSGLIWIGTDDGNIQLTKDGGKSWDLLNENIPDNPEYWVSRVIASHHNEGTAYISYTGRHQDDKKPFLYMTEDFGKTWNSIASNLPHEPINVIREDHKNPNLLFVGTDRTVHVSLNKGNFWNEFRNNLPTIPVHDLVIHPRENDLVVGTFGRGFYITDISPLQEINSDLLNEDVHLFEIETKVQWIMPSQKAVADQNFEGENEFHGSIINYYLKEEISEGVKIAIYDGQILINELKGSGNKGLNSVKWGMTKRGKKKTEEEIAEWDYLMANEEREPFYDYYDTNEHFGSPEDEVGITGLSLRTRVAWEPGMNGREYEYKRVQPGTYTVKLIVGDKSLEAEAVIMQDFWFDK